MAASSIAAVPVTSSQALQQNTSQEGASQNKTVCRIPNRIWSFTLTFSPIKDIATFARTCRIGQEIFNSEVLFKNLVARDFSVVLLSRESISEVSISNTGQSHEEFSIYS